jgi:uncharacterized phage protein gp47/JayE
MTNLNTLTFAQVVQMIAAAVQAQAPLPFNLGSPELALAEADAGVVMWLQSLIVQVLSQTRASTSQGADLDSWMADFDLVTRKPAIAATGTVTFARYTASAQAVIPVGTMLQTADGTQQFMVVADATQAAWNASLSAYVIPTGTASANATVQAVTPGAAGNVNANTITTIAQALSNVDTVTNSQPFTNGQNAESDASLLQRFQLALPGLQDNIKASAAAAIEALQIGVQFSIVENQILSGQAQYGFFYVVISPYSTTTQQAVYAAVDAVRPLSVSFAVYAAAQLAVNVSVTITAAAGYTHTQVAAAVQTALQNFIAQTVLGGGLNYSQLYAVIWGVAGVADATGLLLNGGTTDIPGNPQTAIIPGTITVN